MEGNLQKRENTQTTILALLLARKGGCTLRQLDNDYYELEGERIPYRELGYISLLKFLHSMSKTVQVESKNKTIIVKGIASEKSKHVYKLVAGQKSTQKPLVGRKTYKPSHYYPTTAAPKIHIPAEILCRIIGLINNHPDGVNKDNILQEVSTCMPFTNVTMKDIEDQLQELSHIVFQRNNKVYPIQNKGKISSCTEKDNDMFSCKLEIMEYNEKKWKSAVVTAAGSEEMEECTNYQEDDSFEFVPCSVTSDSSYAKSAAKPKPTSSFIKDTVSKCQDQIAKHASPIETEQNNSRILFDYNNYNSGTQTEMEYNNNEKKDEINCSHNNDAELLINKRVKFRLEKLIQNHPDGIWCADLPKKYLEEYKVPLNYTELGFNSVREFASQLPEIFHCVQIHNTGDYMLYYAKGEMRINKPKEKPKTTLTELHHIYDDINEEEALPGVVTLNTCKILIPDEVMTIGEYVGFIHVAQLVQTEKPFVEALVVEVFTPSFFWIQLRKKQKIFTKFMDDLHNFYVEKGEQYAIPPVVLEKGLNCVCMYNGIWHRAMIKSVNPDFQVTVLFYDYGTLKTYPPEAIYYLHRMFTTLPAQAIPCGLVNTRPCKGSKWSRSATHNFAIRTSQIPLIATIASIDMEDNSMMVTLTDTLGDEDIHINDWLVEQKLAEHGKMVCMKKRNFPFRYYLECQERLRQKKIDASCMVEAQDKNNTALYNLESEVSLPDSKHSSSTTNSNKEESFQPLKSDSSTSNSNQKFPKRRESLCGQLLNLKLKSDNSSNIDNSNDQDNQNAGSGKLYRESDVKDSSIESDTSDRSTNSSSTNTKSNETSDSDYNILGKFINLPPQYANHFNIQDPEDGLDISHYMKGCMDTCDLEYEIEDTVWPAILENTVSERECVPQKNEFKIPHKTIFTQLDTLPLIENCFLRAVYNSTCSALHDKDIPWSPAGNIDKMLDASPQILRNIVKRKRSMPNDVTIAISQSIYESLIDERSSMKLLDRTEKQVSCMVIDQKINTCLSNLNRADSSEVLDSKCLKQNADNKGNSYVSMEVFTPRQRLLQKLLALKDKDVSSNNSTLDSDDFSPQKSMLSDYNVDSEDESPSKNSSKFFPSPVETDMLEVHTRRFTRPEINNFNIFEKEKSMTSETSMTYDMFETFETSILDSIENSNSTGKPLMVNKLPLNGEIRNSLETEETLMKKQSSEIREMMDTSQMSQTPISELIEEFNCIEKPLVIKEVQSNEETKDLVETSLMEEQSLEIREIMEASQTSALDSVENPNFSEESLVGEAKDLKEVLMEEEQSSEVRETMETQLVPIRESASSDIVGETSSIPVFNDIDIESDEEEWDAYISYTESLDLLRKSCAFNNVIQNRLKCEEKLRTEITEISDSIDSDFIENTNNIETYVNEDGDTSEVLHSDRIMDHEIYLSNDEKKEAMHVYENPETQADKVDVHNLLLYVEENLIFKPEQCYEIEMDTCSGDETFSEITTNVPLISPCSTLDDKFFKSPLETVPLKKDKASEESAKQQTSFVKNNTNPFLQDEPAHDQFNDNISPHKFMELWNENLQVQMQITATLNILLNRVIGDSTKNISGNLSNEQKTLNTIKNALLYANRQVPCFMDRRSENIANIYCGLNPSVNNDFTKVAYPVEHPAFRNQHQTIPNHSFYNKNRNFSPSIGSFQNNDILSATSDLNSIDPHFLMNNTINNDFGTANPFFATQQAAISNKFNSDVQNYFANNVNNDMTSTEYPVGNSVPLRETNPFRLSLAGKLRITEPEEQPALHKRHESSIEYDLISFEDDSSNVTHTNQNSLNDYRNTSFNHCQYFISDSVNDVSDVKSNSLAFNEKPVNYKWNVDEVANTMSNVKIDDKSLRHNIYEKRTEKYCFFEENHINRDLPFTQKMQKEKPIHVVNISHCNQSPDLNNYNSFTMLPTSNSMESTAMANDINVEEEHRRHTFAFGALYSSSPIEELTNTTGCSQKPVISSFNQLSSATERESENLDQIYSVSENKEEPLKYNGDQEANNLQNLTTRKVNIEDDVDNTEAKRKQSAAGTAGKKTIIPNFSVCYKVFFRVVELPKRTVHIFCYKGEGWLLVNEFVEAFTTFESTSFMVNLLHVLNICVQFEEIDKTKNSIELIETSSILPKATFDILNGTNKLHLMPIKSAIKMLTNLGIVSQKDMNDVLVHEKFVNNSVVHDIWLITNAYREFKYHVENGQ